MERTQTILEKLVEQWMEKEVKGAAVTRWEDPGDYPNSLAAAPLPPGKWYLEGFEENPELSPEFPWHCVGSVIIADDYPGVIVEDIKGRITGRRGFSVSYQALRLECKATGVVVTLQTEMNEPGRTWA